MGLIEHSNHLPSFMLPELKSQLPWPPPPSLCLRMNSSSSRHRFSFILSAENNASVVVFMEMNGLRKGFSVRRRRFACCLALSREDKGTESLDGKNDYNHIDDELFWQASSAFALDIPKKLQQQHHRDVKLKGIEGRRESIDRRNDAGIEQRTELIDGKNEKDIIEEQTELIDGKNNDKADLYLRKSSVVSLDIPRKLLQHRQYAKSKGIEECMESKIEINDNDDVNDDDCLFRQTELNRKAEVGDSVISKNNVFIEQTMLTSSLVVESVESSAKITRQWRSQKLKAHTLTESSKEDSISTETLKPSSHSVNEAQLEPLDLNFRAKEGDSDSENNLLLKQTMPTSSLGVQLVELSEKRTRQRRSRKLKAHTLTELGKEESGLTDTSVVSRNPSKRSVNLTQIAPLISSGEVFAIISYLRKLRLPHFILERCAVQAKGLLESNVMKLMLTLRELNFTTGNVKSLLSKRPSIIRTEPRKIQDLIRFFTGYGFSNGNAVKLFVKRPSLIDFDIEKMGEILEYLISMGVNGEELLATIIRRPHVLEIDPYLVKFTVSALIDTGIAHGELVKVIKRSPEIFSPSVQENLKENLKFWDSLELTGTSLSRAIMRRPHLLNYDLQDLSASRQFLEDWLLPEDIVRVAKKYAEIFSFHPQLKMEPIIYYLVSLGVKKEAISKVLIKRPQIWAYTVSTLEKNIERIKAIGVKDEVLSKVITMCPQVLTMNTKEKLNRMVDFFYSLGFDHTNDMGVLLSRNGQILCCSVETNLQPKVDFFSSQGLSKTDIKNMILLFPTMLGQNLERSLSPKFDFLVQGMQRSPKELINFPQYFGYSLEKRIKPRFAALQGKSIRTSLPSMLVCTDYDFDRRYLKSGLPSKARE